MVPRLAVENGTRLKRCQEKENFEFNELVFIKDDQLPPSQWTLGRITSLYPREASLVRVVTLKTKSGSQKRSMSKLCCLPISCCHEPALSPFSFSLS